MGPVLVVVVDEEGDLGVVQEVADAAEAGEGGALGLPVEDDVEGGTGRIGVEGEADGDDVGSAGPAGGGEVAYRGGGQALGLLGGQVHVGCFGACPLAGSG